MQLMYFAHNGVEHGTLAEAEAHDAQSRWKIILLTLVVVAIAMAIVYFLSRPKAKHATHHHETKHKED